jgi:hypothetical protein
MITAYINQLFSNLANRAKNAGCAGSKTIPVSALVLLIFATLSTTGCTGLTSAPKSSSGQGTPGAASVSVAPQAIKFGNVSLGQTSSQSVTITNSGSSDVSITSASTTAAGVKITGISLPLTIAAGAQATFNVVFTPKTAGALTGSVSVVSDASTTPSTVTLSGTGTAATALLTSSTNSLKFGTVTIGKTNQLSVTFTNAGNSNITISKVTTSGAAYSGTGVSAGLILTPGQSATLDETFAPTAAGNLSGSVTVTSNSTNSPGTISLSGAGTTTSAHAVALSWTASSSPVAGYDVFRSEVSGGPYVPLDSSLVAGNSYTDSTVQAGQTYYYVVTSVSSSGVQSPDSAQVAATVPTP